MVAPLFELPADFLTLADLQDAWIEAHCVIPDGYMRGKPLKLTDWQFYVLAHRYQVKPNARYVPPEEVTPDNPPVLNQAFVYRKIICVGPQKLGKGPGTAAFTALEACGPCLFAGFAKGGEWYRCADNGCPCGFEYPYEPGEPMGMRHPSPLIQIAAFSEDQADNIYRPLRTMAQMGALKNMLIPRDGFIRIIGASGQEGLDRIDVVTSNANSRLGNPISSAEQDEYGLWTKENRMIRFAETQERGAAGMGGRTFAWTNAWDIAANSAAQRAYELKEKDVFIFYLNPDVLRDDKGKPLDYAIKAHRKIIHEYVYAGSWWVNLDSIEAAAASLIARGELAQAARFFGNMLVAGTGAYIPQGLWTLRTVKDTPTNRIALGFDGSVSGDWTAIRAEDETGLRFTPTFNIGGREFPTIWNPAQHGGRIPRHEVRAAVAQLFSKYEVVRFYCDAREWDSLIDEWAATYGQRKVQTFPTYTRSRMHPELERYLADLEDHETEHVHCEITEDHARNAVKVAAGDKYILGKPQGADHQKIDALMADVLAHSAAMDAHAEGDWKPKGNGAVFFT